MDILDLIDTVHTGPLSDVLQVSERVVCVSGGGGGGGGYAARLFLLFSFPCSADHERDWPPCKVVFFGLATNTLNVRNNLFPLTEGCSEGLGAF